MTKHKLFISYYHKDDEYYRNKFEDLFGDLFINKSVHLGDINENVSDEYIKRLIREDFISDSSIVVVLIGPKTRCRKHVDWEISAGLYNKAGLIGIILPNHKDYNTGHYTSNSIPQRLNDNLESTFASIYNWNEDRQRMVNRINRAFENKNKNSDKIRNSRIQMKNNWCE